ncbi:MAG: DUF11 domain-containing protein [Verrucomicrobia bacterium]|nr:DUF11 domain-containing protein [Verrucomicrobiota bacterium]
MFTTFNRLAVAMLCMCFLPLLRAVTPLPLPFKLAGIVQTNSAPAIARPVDARDHFLGADGKKIPLLRAPDEMAVRYTNDKAPARPAGTVAKRHASFRNKGRFEIVRGQQTLAREPGVRFAYPVLVDPRTRTRMLPTDELLIRLADNVTLADAQADLAAGGVTVINPTGPPNSGTYLARLTKPKTDDPLAVSRRLAAHPKLRWAAPNFVRELRWHKTPGDPLFPYQQSLHNTGQNGAVAGADINATAAWDITTGTNSIVIAIIDEGVDTNHADLAIAPGGWDFANDDADPSPVGNHAHGTACAGIAAAIHNTSLVAGVAGGCRVLPIKIADDTGAFTTDEIIGNAILFAAARADVLSNSWGGGAPNPFIDAAIDYAVTLGRASKGCPVFFATGNSGGTWLPALLSVGSLKEFIEQQPSMSWTTNYYIGFGLQTTASSPTNEIIRIDNIRLIGSDGYTHLNSKLPRQDFEDWFFWFYYQPTTNSWPVNPYGWWLAGNAAWQPDSTDTFLGTGGSVSAVTPNLSPNQYAWLLTPLIQFDGNETLGFDTSLSFSASSTFYIMFFDADYNGIGWLINGYDTVSGLDTNITYPASATNAIAVGASTDCDRRSDFSQYAGKLDFVAPGGGGWNLVATLDITGTNGYSSTDATFDFSGTSAATPHAAGVAALLLSVNPNLTALEVREIMRRTCDKIGGVTYDGGTNLFYGHGRINAWRALAELVPDLAVGVTATPEPASFGSNITYTITVTNLSATHAATGVIVSNTLPAGVVFLNATASQGTCATDAFQRVIADLGDFPTNAPSATITIVATASNYGYLTNTATVALNELDATRSNNAATVVTTVPAANLAISQFAAPLPATANNPLTYFIAVTNLGPFAATSVTVTDALPAGVTFLAASTTQGSCATDAVNNVIANIGTLDLGAGATIQCTVRLPGVTPATYNNTLTVTAIETDPNTANNTNRLVTSVAIDSVGDGIPNWWRQLYFGGFGTRTNALSAATADPDKDGFSNLQEFLAGTHPRNAASAFRIRDSGVTFDTVTNKLYRVEFTGDLVAGPWSNLTSNVIIGTGNAVTVPDPGAAGASRRFYRVRLVPMP